MKRKTFEHFFSNPRLYKYLQASSNDWKRAIALYRSNLRLSQAFYPLLSIVEITLRNSLNHILSQYFNDPNWLTTQQTGFMTNPVLGQLRYPFSMRKSVRKATIKIGLPFSHDKLVTELNFGFWTLFFEEKHYRLIRGRSIQIFYNLPPQIKRQNLYTILNDIRNFRNRVYHYEPICFDYNVLNLQIAQDALENIYDILSWLNPDLVVWTELIDFVNYEISRFGNHNNNNVISFYANAFKLKSRYLIKKIHHTFKIEKYI